MAITLVNISSRDNQIILYIMMLARNPKGALHPLLRIR